MPPLGGKYLYSALCVGLTHSDELIMSKLSCASIFNGRFRYMSSVAWIPEGLQDLMIYYNASRPISIYAMGTHTLSALEGVKWQSVEK